MVRDVPGKQALKSMDEDEETNNQYTIMYTS